MLPSACGSLDECESLLEQELAGKALIGELELGLEDVEYLGKFLRHEQQSIRFGRPSAHLWSTAPCCSACFTIGVFVHHYDDDRSFWPRFGELLPLEASEESVWRDEFEEFLATRDMPLFDQVPGYRFLRHVRIHALMTADGAERVFEHVVSRAISEGLSEGEWTARELLSQIGVGIPPLRKPEDDFLRHGGYVADDVLGRCLALCRAAVYANELDDFGLPAHVVAAFRRWLNRRPRSEGTFAKERGATIAAHLRLDLGRAAVLLALRPPETKRQQLEVALRNGDDRARGAPIDTWSINVDPYLRQRENRYEREVPMAAHRYDLAWRDDDSGEAGEWQLAPIYGLMGDSIPWAAFSATDDNHRLSRQQYLPRGEVWLACPRTTTLTGICLGEAAQPEDLEPIETLDLPSWQMRVRRIDTSKLARVQLGEESTGNVTSETIAVDMMPEFVVEHCLPGVTVDGYPVSAASPGIRFAGNTAESITEIECVKSATVRTGATLAITGTELPSFFEQHMGVFRLRFRGRLGRRSEPLEIAVIPGLQVEFDPQLVLPGADTCATVRITTPSQISISGDVEDPDVKEWKSRQAHEVCALTAPDCRRLRLQLDLFSPSGRSVRADFGVVIPRLLVGTRFGATSEESLLPAVATLTRADIRKNASMQLELSLQPDPEAWKVELRALPLGGQMTKPERRYTASPIVSFDLSSWRDAILASSETHQLRATVLLQDGTRLEPALVGHIVTETNLKLEWRFHNGQSEIKFRFGKGAVPCDLRACNLTYPWLAPVPIRLEGRQKGSVPVSSLPPAEYWIEPITGVRGDDDILPGMGTGCRLPMASPGDKPRGYEALIRELARIWDGVWTLDGGAWSFDANRARVAEQATKQFVESARPPSPRATACEADLRNTILLLLSWGQGAAGYGGQASMAQWKRAVTFVVVFIQRTQKRSSLFHKLLQQLETLRQRAGSNTQELCRLLRGLILRVQQHPSMRRGIDDDGTRPHRHY